MRYIVTLTSYGRRVGTSLIATLQSLVEQTVKPDRIVVWLGNNEWNSGNLPSALQDIVRSNEGGGGGIRQPFLRGYALV
ncbi:MAG: hypothetical protein LBP19_07105 [Treponema sp.]|jgi:hypothetical protein|nr:hypothetical protein [Treponema sp.]